MLGALVTDLMLVVIIELQLHAVETVARRPEPLLLFHAAVSTLVLILYGLMLWAGLGLLRGREVRRAFHRRTAVAFVALRLTNFATSFLV